jgi:putative SOS response-associated peptidase YedK
LLHGTPKARPQRQAKAALRDPLGPKPGHDHLSIIGHGGKSPKGEEVLSCTVLTCEPNKLVGELHDRMPVILPEGEWPKWLGEEPATEDELLAMVKPCADESLKMWPVDRMVGNVKNNGAQLLTPA